MDIIGGYLKVSGIITHSKFHRVAVGDINNKIILGGIGVLLQLQHIITIHLIVMGQHF